MCSVRWMLICAIVCIATSSDEEEEEDEEHDSVLKVIEYYLSFVLCHFVVSDLLCQSHSLSAHSVCS